MRHHADDFNAMLALVAAGQGVALVPQLAIAQPPPQVRLVPLTIRRRTRIAYRRGAGGHPAVAACVTALRTATRDHLEEKPQPGVGRAVRIGDEHCMSRTIRLALVGDRLLDAAAQAPVAQAVAGLGSLAGRKVEASWILTTEVDAAVKGFDGVWLTGSPYRSEPGIVTAAGIARRVGFPCWAPAVVCS